MFNAEHICLSSVKTRVEVRLTSNIKLWHLYTRKMMAFINDLCHGRDKAFINDLCHGRDKAFINDLCHGRDKDFINGLCHGRDKAFINDFCHGRY